MLNSNLAIDIVIRLSIVLTIGWLALWISAKQNPRWSVLITRCMMIAGLGLPLVYLCLPAITLAVLPASPIVIAEDAKSTSASPMNGEHAPQEKPDFQPLAPTSNVMSGPVIAETESRLPVPALRESETAVMVPQMEVEDLPLAASDPVRRRGEASPDETLANNSTAINVSQESTATSSLVSHFHWIGVCWLVGCFLLLLKIGLQIRQAKQLPRSSVAASESIQRECAMLARNLSLRTIPRVYVSTAINGPCTAGLLRSSIFLPDSWSESLSDEERRAVLMHELSHIVGRDSLWDFGSRIVTALWWFHPLVWRLTARHRLSCEHMSDARAADSIAGFKAYRQMLAQWTLRRQGAESNSAVLAMADRSFMLRRLKWLEAPRSFKTLGRVRRTAFLSVAVLISLSVASIKFIPQAVAQKTEAVEQLQKAEKPKPSSTEQENAEKENAEKNRRAKPAPRKRKPNVADIDTSRTTPKLVRVVDEKDQPIAGATVRIGWWEDNEGDIALKITLNPPVTNDKGEVTIQVPAGAARAQISAEAKGYAKGGTQYSLNGTPRLVLQPGRIVRVKAVDTKGEVLPEAYPLLEDSRILGREFKQDQKRIGYFTSPVVKLNRRWMRVVDRNGEGPVLFSHLIDITNPDRVEKDGTIVAILEPGIRLEGRLDDSVPRPIKNGCVELYINEGEDHKINKGWTWQETASVKADGTFVFDSLPTGGHVQLFALVDGFQSTRPSVESLKNYLQLHNAGSESILANLISRHDAFWPHLFPLTPGLFKTEIELPCTPTTSLDIRVVDSLGQAIEEAEVRFNPNGHFLGGELFIPATETLTMANYLIRRDQGATKERLQWAQDTFLRVPTDAKGLARVRNLPADDRQSYRVSAEGYQMPVYPASSPGGPSRYALVDLTGGETLHRTITLEKTISESIRRIPVVNSQAEPVPGIKVTVSELAFEDSPNDWQVWSSQRFGPLATDKTAEDGIAQLKVPLEIGGRSVSLLRVAIQGRVSRDSYVQKSLVIPRKADGRVIILKVSEQQPLEKNRLRDVDVTYQKPETLLSKTPEVLVQQLQKKPSLVILNRLLQLHDFHAATPLRFQSDWNLTGKLGQKKSERSPIASISTEQGERVIVLCEVRPQGATWDIKPELRFPPRAAFLFDAADGSLIRMIGGWASSSGDYNHLMLVNLGGTDDYFIATSAFETHGPFENIQRWYQVGREAQPALTFYGYPNATSWNGKPGPSTPVGEYGYLALGFNGKDLDHRVCGVLPNGVQAPRKLYWDGSRNQFIGPVEESVEGTPLYQVDRQNSHQFVPLELKPGELMVAGGRRSYQNWHQWDCVVPAGKTARLRLFTVDESEDKPVEKEYFAQNLTAGKHNLQLQFMDHQQKGAVSEVEVRIDQTVKKKLTVPQLTVNNVPSVKGTPVARTANDVLDLFNRETEKQQQRLIWRVELIEPSQSE